MALVIVELLSSLRRHSKQGLRWLQEKTRTDCNEESLILMTHYLHQTSN